jgi:hypothetical protein
LIVALAGMWALAALPSGSDGIREITISDIGAPCCHPHRFRRRESDGAYLHEHPNGLPEEEQLYWLRRASEVIRRVTGKHPRGIRAPTYKFSAAMLDHLVADGFDYDASLMGDDVPYLLTNGQGSVVGRTADPLRRR